MLKVWKINVYQLFYRTLLFYSFIKISAGQRLCGVGISVLVYNIVVSEFELQPHASWEVYKPFSPFSCWLECASTVFFYKGGLRIKWPTKDDMPLKKLTF